MQFEKSFPYIIAEAATNHDGNIDKALELVDIASRSGADSVKFQIINPTRLYIPEIIIDGKKCTNESIVLREKSKLSYDEYTRIKQHCDEQKIDFSASVFDDEALAYLVTQKPKYIKIASCDLNNIELVLNAVKTGLWVILSTGMSILVEIEKSLDMMKREGIKKIILMHCISLYPTKLEDSNLGFIETLKKTFDMPIGFSDHTLGSLAAVIAVAKGAQVIEKHFTYSNKAYGFDHVHSLEEHELYDYIQTVRSAALAISRSERVLTEQEKNVSVRARRSLYAARDISIGETIVRDDILVVRPQADMLADQIYEVLGCTATQTIKKFEPLSLQKIKK